MKIYLLRHAQAAAAYPDSTRPLTEAGREHARSLADFLRRNAAMSPQVIWRSPYLRAKETADILIETLGLESSPLHVRDDLTPDSGPKDVLAEIPDLSGDVLIVGHNPHLSVLAALLLSGERGRVRIDLQTCNLVCLEWFSFPNYGETGPCALSWMLDPRML